MEKISEEKLDEQIEKIKELYRKEIPDFKEMGYKFLNGDISTAEFKAVSGGMGVYAQRSGKEFMIRLRTLSGVLDFKTFKLIQSFAHKYSLDFIHMTTRQTIQLHNLQFDDVIDIMEESLDYNLITRGGGGNFPRNVSLSSLSGVEKDESFDVTPYAVLVNKYFVSQINTYRLPRKFKVAFSNNGQDSANASIADMGFLAIKKEGKEYFQAYLGGSLGHNCELSVPFDELINPNEILYHIEALLNLFREEGDYQNKSKARIRFIVKRMGREAFLQCYKSHLANVKETQKLDFAFINNYQVTTESLAIEKLDYSPDVILQKQENLHSVVIHPKGGILNTNDLNNILEFIEKLPDVQVRLTMEESMVIRNLTAQQTKELLVLTKDLRNTTRLGKSVCCIGVPTCQIGVQNSQALLSDILDYFKDKNIFEDILPSIHISGCINSCSRHQVSEIGFQGKKNRVNGEMKDAYALHIGGNYSREDTHLSKEYGDLLASDIPAFLYKLAIQLREKKLEFNEYLHSQTKEFESILENYLI